MFSESRYHLLCLGCGTRMVDDGIVLSCTSCADGALLRTVYDVKDFRVQPENDGIFRFSNWLPARRQIANSATPSVYRSEGLAKALGLTDLWISFSGNWPEKGAHLRTGSFKELEAYTVLARIPATGGILVVASAGNTGAAFFSASGSSVLPCVVVVPSSALAGFPRPVGDFTNLRVVALRDAGYNEVLRFAKELAATSPRYIPEGGVRNVARRDGLGIVALNAFEHMGELPEYYFQGVGSASGAIGYHEAVGRIVDGGDGAGVGRVGPELMLCQNREFAPLHARWNGYALTGSGEKDVYAPELVNNTPPFDPVGGVKQVLAESSGDVLLAGYGEASHAAGLFLETEGVRLAPAAAVAVACLAGAARSGRVRADAKILLNVTGGGMPGAGAGVVPEEIGDVVWEVSPDTPPGEISQRILDTFRVVEGAL